MAIILVIVATCVFVVLYKIRNAGRRPMNYPPGPPTLPIIGNLHQLPASQPHLQFKKWADEYGPVYSLMLGASVTIVLSSDVAIKDLLDKRSHIYSSRPPFYIGQILSGGWRMLLMEYGSQWRMIRKTVHQHLNIKAARSYIPYQDLENRKMMVDFLEKPDRWQDHLRRYTNSLTTQMVYGFRTTSTDDPKMHQLFDGFAEFAECITSPMAQLLDCFPLLQHVPTSFMPVKRKARNLHKKEQELYLGHWMSVKEKIKNGTVNPCVCVDLVNSQNREGFSDNLACYISGSLLEAGSDTTYSTLVGWMQAMLLFPGVAKQAREELDRVCGERFPTLEDEPKLQYIRGCVKESMRWMPTGILGVPHAAMCDDEYMGYRISKGASVIWNVWGIHNDEKRFPNPRAFDPSRYANDSQSSAEAATNADPTQRDHFLFGAGRRVCQGMHIADRSLFLAYARILWAFNFDTPENEDGSKVLPDPTALTEGLFVLPKPFAARIVPRSKERANIIREEWTKVTEKLDEYAQWKRVPEGMFFKEYVPLED